MNPLILSEVNWCRSCVIMLSWLHMQEGKALLRFYTNIQTGYDRIQACRDLRSISSQGECNDQWHHTIYLWCFKPLIFLVRIVKEAPTKNCVMGFPILTNKFPRMPFLAASKRCHSKNNRRPSTWGWFQCSPYSIGPTKAEHYNQYSYQQYYVSSLCWSIWMNRNKIWNQS